MIALVYLKNQVLAIPLLSTDHSFQKPITQNLYHSLHFVSYYTKSFLNFRKLKKIILLPI